MAQDRSGDEIRRLAQVYHTYRTSASIQARWDESNPGNRAMLQERQRALKRLLGAHGFLPLASQKVLDVGCGSGKVLASLLEMGAEPDCLYGVDLLPDRIAEASRCYPMLRFQCANAEDLDFPDAHFNLVLLFTVFSSILDDRMAHNVAREVHRVLKPGGAVLWYDFRYNNPWNPHVRGMTRRHIHQFFPDFEVRLHTITLLPPLARRLGRLTPAVYPLLSSIPFLCTHYLGLLIKRQEAPHA
jgi:ubiquinone/menaquinone biosynthesis C-methylase UbiE